MSTKVLNLIRGIGSVLCVMQPPVPAMPLRFVNRNVSDSLRLDWISIGSDFRRALMNMDAEAQNGTSEK